MDIKNLTPQKINEMDYNELIGLVKETNRPPGGRKTVFEIANRTFLNKNSEVLEIGTSTGFTAIELSKLVKCKITSIDINEMSLEEARLRAKEADYENINFLKADVNELPFQDSKFDLIIVGNVFSLMANKERAFAECRRVCKKNGFIAAVPMFYTEEPSSKLVRDVSHAIKVNITPLYKKDWNKFFSIPDVEIYFDETYKFNYMADETIQEFVKNILDREHLKVLSKEAYAVLKKKYEEFMFLFRENLSKMGFSIILLSNKNIWEDPELYTSYKMD